jgi:hypothetical protein
MTLPILKASAARIKAIWQQACEAENVFVVDFSHVAQQARTYQSYTQQIAELPAEELDYLGIALYGDKKAINRLTGTLPLL